MSVLSKITLATCLALATFTPSNTFGDVFGTGTPYLSSADSPFTGLSFDYSFLENFEDGSINTPGLIANGGFLSFVNRDSVDADDGSIDGSGSTGLSYAQQAPFASVSFQFDDSVLGALPTRAGVVWTDGGVDGLGNPGSFTFEAFDDAGLTLGSVTTMLGDGFIAGPTDEDRFFGATNSSGISSITFTSNSANGLSFIEVDHVQYARAVPEPSSCVVLAAVLGFGWMRNRRK